MVRSLIAAPSMHRARLTAGSLLLVSALVIGTIVSATAMAQSPPPVTATCKDGSSFSGTSKRGACAHHGGVKVYTPATESQNASPPIASSAPATNAAPAVKAAAGNKNGGSGQVWVNTTSNVYHCPGTRYYGKTKAGEYMSESTAKAKGFRPSQGKVCS